MVQIAFPHDGVVAEGKPFTDSAWAAIDAHLARGVCPHGWLEVETEETRLVCLVHQSRPHLAGLVEPGGFSWVPLANLPPRAAELEGAAWRLVRADPVRVLLLAVHFRHKPALWATTDLVDLAHVLRVLQAEGQDAALALERDGARTLVFLQQGRPARLYFGRPDWEPGEGGIADRLLLHAFQPNSPIGRLEVFKRLAIEPDPDAGKTLQALSQEARPPPPTLVQVTLGGRPVAQRAFMPPAMLIGRDRGCDIILDNLSVSRQHARLGWRRGRFVLEDLGSANGTTVNGKTIREQAVGADDRIGLGKFVLQLAAQPELKHPEPTMLLGAGPPGASPALAVPSLYLVGEDLALPLGEQITIGKTQGVDVRARGFWVKALHARLKREGDGYRLTCLGNAEAQVNGRPVRSALVKVGDELVIGRSRFTLAPNLAEERTEA
jgi:pSer/pThr/pTyr-binding forkhead associated (FHA) protein